MTDAVDLANVNTAITAAMKAKSFKHGDDTKENQALNDLLDARDRIEARIKRGGRGPRVQRIRLRHG